jgi:NADH dehydrogenase
MRSEIETEQEAGGRAARMRLSEKNSQPHVVIVGGGFGGVAAARGLARAPVRVTLIDRANYHLFQPLLYQVATAGLSPADIAAPIRHILRRQSNTRVLMAEVTGVDTQGKQVHLANRSLAYDYLILATGARHSYFGHPEWEQYAPGLKTLQDATAVRMRLLHAFERAEMAESSAQRVALLTFIVVGGGPTGVEMAGAIAELARFALKTEFRHIAPETARILLLEAGPRLLASFPDHLGRQVQQRLEAMGVEVRTGARVEQVDAEGVVVNGTQIHSATVIWAAGVAASSAGQWLHAPTDHAGRIQVEPDLTVPGNPDVFAIGDTMTLQQDGAPLPGVAQVAMQQGRYVAALIRDRLAGKPKRPPFRYHDKGNMATVGRSFAIADLKRLQFGGFVAWVFWLVLHIVFLIGFRNRLLVLIQWAWAYFTYQRGVRLITEIPEPRPEANRR